jgi:hypothetical protein
LLLISFLLFINFDKGTVSFVKMLLHLWMMFLLLPIVAFGDGTNVISDPIVMGYLYTALLLVVAPYIFNSHRTVGHSSPNMRRQRQDVSSLFHEHGPIYAWRAYRMDTDSFWALHRMRGACQIAHREPLIFSRRRVSVSSFPFLFRSVPSVVGMRLDVAVTAGSRTQRMFCKIS